MATSEIDPFARPQIRWLLGVVVMIWLGATLLLTVTALLEVLPIPLTDPLWVPVVYLLLFGGSSLWILSRYRCQGVPVRSLLGTWPSPFPWLFILGLVATVFVFSLGAFQLSYSLLSLTSPDYVEALLGQSIFLGSEETVFPLLYNGLILLVLVIGAPVLEEFLFRGVLLHRLGNRWGVPVAVVLSSITFGLLHANAIGLSVFGLVMALLYLRTRSLGLVIVAHALNNGAAACLDRLSVWFMPDAELSLESFRSSWGLGALFLGVSIPFLLRFVSSHWKLTRQPLPYFKNQAADS